MHVPIVNRRYQANEAFTRARWRAILNSIKARITNSNKMLLDFNSYFGEQDYRKSYLGFLPIPLDEIIGSVGRTCEFDHSFMPLKSYLKERWVKAVLAWETKDQSPVQVFKVGRHYFVEQGHEMVSTYRYLDMDFIDAEVWEFSFDSHKTKTREITIPGKLQTATKVSRVNC